MWDYEQSIHMIEEFDCLSQGNLLTISDLTMGGPMNFTSEYVPCEIGEYSYSKNIILNLLTEMANKSLQYVKK